MPQDAEQSLLDRLQALRGSSASCRPPTSASIPVDLIERQRAPTRDDVLAARLKRLRHESSTPQAPIGSPPRQTPTRDSSIQSALPPVTAQVAEAALQTDHGVLEELLSERHGIQTPPGSRLPAIKDPDVHHLLHDLARSASHKDQLQGDSDDSDAPQAKREVDHVIARFRHEIKLDSKLESCDETPPSGQQDDDPSLALPSVPVADSLPTCRSNSLDDITARLAALRTSSKLDSDSALLLPSVPTDRPSAADPVRRLTSKTAYTDHDMYSWCIVCLEDGTLRCLGCDADPYCARCWRDMHIGPVAAFGYQTHRAVQFAGNCKDQDEKFALGAS
ncbi:hypothetical protein CDD82_3921 [Ophiocordyceps australis]|uniref:Uncharacterized protein n=1 Tax=Ophiocordyceps australis TaxID=1399860 RepID=A0A2C5ZB07_9HYPO|nr:hypothetical protein CDD82_3921 [Ophiocordyceps australis]